MHFAPFRSYQRTKGGEILYELLCRTFQRGFLSGQIGYRHKKGIPLYPNLVNLKSNTMKNTM